MFVWRRRTRRRWLPGARGAPVTAGAGCQAASPPRL